MLFLNTLLISKLRRILVCIALLAYGMQSFAFAGGLMMGMSTSEPVVIDVSESTTMPGCHMNTMVFNDDGATKTRDISAAAVTVVKPNCCAGDLCENSCSMTNCSFAVALISTISLPWFVIVKPSPYTFEATSLVYYPRSFSRPPISS